MNKFLILLVALVFVASGCGKKAEEVKMPSEFEEMATEIETMPRDEAAKTPVMQPKEGEIILPQPVESKIESVESLEQSKPALTTAKPTVEEIQKALKNANLYQGKIDGVLGAKTKKAVADFQTENSLKPDGKVGPKTWEKLKVYLNKTAASASY